MEVQEVTSLDVIISALYLKISDDRKELKKLTYKNIFSLINLKNPQRLLHEISALLPEKDIFKIQGILQTRQRQKSIDQVALYRLANLMQVGALDTFASYHIVRSSEFKYDIHLALGKNNEAASNIDKYHFGKSDEIYNYIVERFSHNQDHFFSINEAKELAINIKDEFHIPASTEKRSIFRQSLSIALQDKNYKELSIYWGTNRISSHSPEGRYFTDEKNEKVERSEQLNVGRSLVTVPDVHKQGEIERPAKWWKFWKSRKEDANQHIVIHSIELMKKDEWCTTLNDEQSKTKNEGMLFIHGYNCSFDDALYRTAQLKYDLKFEGLTFCFGWASRGQVASYPVDESTINWSVTHLEEFIELITKEIKISKLHIVAHSMGNRALIDVIQRWNEKQKKCVHTVVLAAPDVDAGTMKNAAAFFTGFKNVTLYSSEKDIAVNISNSVHHYPRAGNSSPPLVLANTDTIDVSELKRPIFSLGHSYFAEAFKVFNDMYSLIKDKKPAADRISIKYKQIWQCYVLA